MNIGCREVQELKVLIVDDDPDSCEFLATFLEEFAVATQTANSCEEALSTIECWQPDVVISDIAMPDHDSYYLLTQLQIKGIPAIALTALPDDEREFALMAGFCGWLSKPVEFNNLLSALMCFMPIKSARPSSDDYKISL